MKKERETSLALRAARIVDNQHDIDTVDLQQVHKEAAVSLRVQAHSTHMLVSQGRIRAPCDLQQGLKDTVVLLHEEPSIQKHTNYLYTEYSSTCGHFARKENKTMLNSLHWLSFTVSHIIWLG